jgi:hypothetical protein
MKQYFIQSIQARSLFFFEPSLNFVQDHSCLKPLDSIRKAREGGMQLAFCSGGIV